MIRFQAFGVRFSLPMLTLAAPILARQLGMQSRLGGLTLALCAHELAHLFTAKLCCVAIQEIRLLPFGGSAQMENPYQLPLRQILPVAIAGPGANLFLAIILAALTHWNILNVIQAAELIRPNLVLFVFNLLPALPLDGGRILFALLRITLGEKKALTAGLWSGRILAFILLSATIYSGLKRNVWNLSFILCALFVLACGQDEKRAHLKSRIQQLSDLLTSDFEGRPARLYPLDASTHADRALSLLRPREPGWFMLTQNGRPAGMLSAQQLLNYLLNGGAPETTLGDLLNSSPGYHSGAT